MSTGAAVVEVEVVVDVVVEVVVDSAELVTSASLLLPHAAVSDARTQTAAIQDRADKTRFLRCGARKAARFDLNIGPGAAYLEPKPGLGRSGAP